MTAAAARPAARNGNCGPARAPTPETARLAAGWPLAELVAYRRAELGLSTATVVSRMRQAAAEAGEYCLTTTTGIKGLERHARVPRLAQHPALAAIALDLPTDDLQAAADAQRTLKTQRAASAPSPTGTPSPDATPAAGDVRAA